ncbi:MAG: hypothetical protein IJS00_06635 [Paludibacteraceae bacterium]|nr:hypothetical protein [Paludibacteraceae bacterium]
MHHIHTHYIFVFHYNYTTALIAVSASLTIYKALTQQKKYLMLIAGMIVGVGVFFRLPNICLVAFIAILIPFYYQTQSLKTTMRFFGAAVVGFAIGVVLNIALICLLHHQETFIASVKHTFDTFLTHTHTHTGADTLLSRCRIYAIVFVAYFVLTSLYDTSLWSYRDKGSRVKKTVRPELTLQHTTFTSKENAAQLDTLMTHLIPHIHSNTYILAYPNIPAINYLTRTPAYLDNPWEGIITYDNFCTTFENAVQTKPLPVIVLGKGNDTRWNIPNKEWTDIYDCPDWHTANNEKKSYIAEFISQYHYTIVWENPLFQILTPQ